MTAKKVWGTIIILLSVVVFGISGYIGYTRMKGVIHISERYIKQKESAGEMSDAERYIIRYTQRGNSERYHDVALCGVLMLCSVFGAVVGTKMVNAK